MPVPAFSQRALPERTASIRSAGSHPATRSCSPPALGLQQRGRSAWMLHQRVGGLSRVRVQRMRLHPSRHLRQQQPGAGRTGPGRKRERGVMNPREERLDRGSEDPGQREGGLHGGLCVPALDGVERLPADAHLPRQLILRPALDEPPLTQFARGTLSHPSRVGARRSSLSSWLDFEGVRDLVTTCLLLPLVKLSCRPSEHGPVLSPDPSWRLEHCERPREDSSHAISFVESCVDAGRACRVRFVSRRSARGRGYRPLPVRRAVRGRQHRRAAEVRVTSLGRRSVRPGVHERGVAPRRIRASSR